MKEEVTRDLLAKILGVMRYCFKNEKGYGELDKEEWDGSEDNPYSGAKYFIKGLFEEGRKEAYLAGFERGVRLCAEDLGKVSEIEEWVTRNTGAKEYMDWDEVEGD